ncbi:hypothetical protein ASG52_19900 [Methylobacterium sp. Leaf456]|uniref:hypothetical protein n=1 Tax=Methylobacterium sp. Leaf456 TaxID=1736382 RepID=UPI000702225A|nr:hypothetical protein [Methylobacterium sp. Leaf456]KQT59991.1 hypothetical protein ASG52_19900 [Methylobacterium sp. Leaf456]
MLWLFPRPPAPPDPAVLDALLAQTIEAQRRAGDAAEDVTQAADDNREHVGAAVGALKERSAERLRHRGRGHLSSDVRAVVEATLQQMDERARHGQERSR